MRQRLKLFPCLLLANPLGRYSCLWNYFIRLRGDSQAFSFEAQGFSAFLVVKYVCRNGG